MNEGEPKEEERGRRREEEVEADDDGWLYSYRGVERASERERER